MKSDVKQSIVRMEPKVLRQWVTEVKETLATDVDFGKNNPSKGAFGIVNLWNIHRNRKTGGSRQRKTTIITGIGY